MIKELYMSGFEDFKKYSLKVGFLCIFVDRIIILAVVSEQNLFVVVMFEYLPSSDEIGSCIFGEVELGFEMMCKEAVIFVEVQRHYSPSV